MREDGIHADIKDDALMRRRSPFRRLMAIILLLVAMPFLLTVVYAAVPPVSTLMLARWATMRPVERTWVPLEAISPHLVNSVIASEDARFCAHHGVDWGAVREVFAAAEGGLPGRGASTITMQTAKNLFLWHGAPALRKPAEVILAHWIDFVWPKSRTIEVYLNIAEWGPDGVFGAEAGAQRAFGKSAKDLTAREAALMAASLPNPVTRNPGKPSTRLSRRAATVQARARAAAEITVCLKDG